MSKRWNILNTSQVSTAHFQVQELIEILLANRGIVSKKESEAFLNPKLEDVTPQNVGIDTKQLAKALKRIKKAIDTNEKIVVFGDYDVDGITGSAILWETLHDLGASCMPYIPNRVDEGYGLSLKALQNPEFKKLEPTLLITVDNGIVAHEAVAFAKAQGIDVIITDHHTVSEKLPDAYAIVHTTSLCGAGVAYLLGRELGGRKSDDSHLELAALGTVADLVPLTGANRTIVFHGLKKLRTTIRHGLVALFNQAGIKQDEINVYDIGYIIGPRLNASGRIDSAMDSLRLLCTTNVKRAGALAAKLELTNRERQLLLREAAEHAIAEVGKRSIEPAKLLVVAHESYKEGVIGLVAGRLVEAFYRPAIVLSIGETHSKASARSVNGFNIIEFLRSHQEYFVNVGGHPMAAGFTIETVKIQALQNALEKTAETLLDEAILTRSLKIDYELPFSVISTDLYNEMQKLAPFGMANPEPVFACRNVTIENIKVMGKESNHLKLILRSDEKIFEAVAFGMGALAAEVRIGDKIDVAFSLDENTWNGTTKLQLKVKDINI